MESPHTTSEMSQLAAGTHNRPVWSSQQAYIIASIAGVVGLGNLWRFPYMVGENGGGTFILAYVICILAVGLPLMVLESSAGNLTDRGPVGTFRYIHPRWGPWVGWFLVVLTIAIMSYYFVITGWTLGYAIDAIRGSLKLFDDFTSGVNSLWYFIAASILVLLVMWQGISGIEKISRFLLPLLVLVVISLAIFGQTLSGAKEARDFYFSFDLARFLEPTTWRMAAGQAFYSLGIGQAMLITYGSYTPHGVNIVTSSATVIATNSLISLAAGLMVFPIVFTFGLAPDSGSQLSFTAFPVVFGEISGGRILGIAFFVLLFMAAFTSCIGGMAVVLAPIRDEFRVPRWVAASIGVAIVFVLGIPSALSFTSFGLTIGDMRFLDFIDQITGSGVVIVAGIGGASLISWRILRTDLIEAMNSRFTRNWIVLIGRFLPVAAVLLLLVTFLI